MGLIYDYLKETGYSPTISEMRERLKVASNQSILDLLKKLESGQLIKKTESAARSISILPLAFQLLSRPPLVEFMGATSAGSPIGSIEITGEWQVLPSFQGEKVSKLKNDVFLLKIHGDSMINAGIDNEDIVLVQKQKEFISGDIVLAQIGDESTIKRFISDDKPPYVYLKPENPKYQNIPFTEEMRLEGKVISISKNGYWQPLK